MPLTAASWLSNTTAGPLNFRIDSSTPAVFGEGMLDRSDRAVLPVQVQFFPAPVLAEGCLRRHAAGRSQVELADPIAVGLGDVPMPDGLAEGRGMHGRLVAVDEAGTVEF